VIGVALVAGRSQPPTPGSPALARAQAAAANRQYTAAWRELTLHGGRVAVARATQCAPNSFGQVRDFFVRTPCRSLRRELLAVSDTRGNTIAVSIVWVQLPSGAAAQDLKRLADASGTGNVKPISNRRPDVATARFNGNYYASRRSGSLVVIAEAAPTRGHPSATLLHQVAQVGAAFPPPP
jgi:hypothetical protein